MKPESADEDRRAREEQVLEVLDGRRRRRGARASTSKRFNDAMLDGSGVSAFKAAFCANMSSPVHARKIGTQPGAVRRMRRRSVRGAARRTAEAHPRVIVRLVDVLDPERAPARASIMSYGPEGLKSKDTQVADASKPIAYRALAGRSLELVFVDARNSLLVLKEDARRSHRRTSSGHSPTGSHGGHRRCDEGDDAEVAAVYDKGWSS
jgi:hypothetical protein